MRVPDRPDPRAYERTFFLESVAHEAAERKERAWNAFVILALSGCAALFALTLLASAHG